MGTRRVDVGGIFADGASLIEVTGNTATVSALRVRGGRLDGTLPALSAVVLATG